jgi:hypothetical protein
MIALTQPASALLALVAQNPEVSQPIIDRLLREIDAELEPIVRRAVQVIQEQAHKPEIEIIPTDPAEAIAKSYLVWSRQNAAVAAR